EAQQRALSLRAGTAPGDFAAVQRGTQTFISDSVIFYSDSARRISIGGRYVISDPSTGQADIVGHAIASYRLTERLARVPNAKFNVKMGETWYLTWRDAAVAGDSAGSQTLYAAGG